MAVTFAALNTALDAAQTAVGTGTWADVRKYLLQAGIILIGLPTDASDPGRTVRYGQQIDKLLAVCDAAEASAGATSDDKRRLIRTQTRHAG